MRTSKGCRTQGTLLWLIEGNIMNHTRSGLGFQSRLMCLVVALMVALGTLGILVPTSAQALTVNKATASVSLTAACC